MPDGAKSTHLGGLAVPDGGLAALQPKD
jgi:hypothetical protein